MCDHSTPAEPVRYELRVEGQLGPEWSAWFAGLVVTPDADGTTRLTGPVIDQAALYGLLRQVRDLGLPLIAVNRVPSVAPGARSTRLPTATRMEEQGMDSNRRAALTAGVRFVSSLTEIDRPSFSPGHWPRGSAR